MSTAWRLWKGPKCYTCSWLAGCRFTVASLHLYWPQRPQIRGRLVPGLDSLPVFLLHFQPAAALLLPPTANAPALAATFLALCLLADGIQTYFTQCCIHWLLTGQRFATKLIFRENWDPSPGWFHCQAQSGLVCCNFACFCQWQLSQEVSPSRFPSGVVSWAVPELGPQLESQAAVPYFLSWNFHSWKSSVSGSIVCWNLMNSWHEKLFQLQTAYRSHYTAY